MRDITPAIEDRPLQRLYAVVLAGGSGTRFWPLSRDLNPKQMLTVFGEESLIVQAIQRAGSLAGGGLLVLGNEALQDELRDHFAARGMKAELLSEPAPRNTAAAIALAAATCRERDEDAVVMVLPSDHIIDGAEGFRATMREAASLAEAGWLVTVGVEPTGPETAYGYIQAGEAIDGAATARRAKRFVEKPDRGTAEGYLAAGSYLWNGGILVARADRVLAELAKAGEAAATENSSHGARIAAAAAALGALAPSEWSSDPAADTFRALPAVPFDEAVLEVSDRVAVVPGAFEWSDVGSLLSISRLADADANGNVLVGRAVDVGSRDSIVFSTDRLVATLGLDDALVVDTADATLVTTKGHAQDVRLVVDALRASGAAEVVRPRTVLRPWGSWTLLLRGEGFQIKLIEVRPGSRLSLQTHHRRSEHWAVVHGTARVTVDDLALDLDANQSAYIPMGSAHRLENTGDGDLRIVEVAIGAYLEEDDIVRHADDWGR